MRAWLQLAGYSSGHYPIQMETIGAEVIGPSEARRFLGPEVGDAVSLTGPGIIVLGRIPLAEFQSDGTTYAYHDGMVGTFEVRIRSEPALFALLPALRYFTERRRD